MSLFYILRFSLHSEPISFPFYLLYSVFTLHKGNKTEKGKEKKEKCANRSNNLNSPFEKGFFTHRRRQRFQLYYFVFYQQFVCSFVFFRCFA